MEYVVIVCRSEHGVTNRISTLLYRVLTLPKGNKKSRHHRGNDFECITMKNKNLANQLELDTTIKRSPFICCIIPNGLSFTISLRYHARCVNAQTLKILHHRFGTIVRKSHIRFIAPNSIRVSRNLYSDFWILTQEIIQTLQFGCTCRSNIRFAKFKKDIL
jgi:hypothetical protein